MKNLSILILVCTLAFITAKAQAPQSFKYQAIARNLQGKIMNNQNINVRFTIIDSAAGGANVYSEIHKTNTNDFGLFKAEIGRGLAPTGVFENIPWITSNKWLQIEMDPTGGTNFQVIGIGELISVPYALFAETTGNVDDADANPANEFNTRLSLNGTTLEIEDNGSTLTQDLSSLIDDADASPTNEYNTNLLFNQNTNILTIADVGNNFSVDLSSLAGGGLAPGNGIDISSGTISNTGDLDSTNEFNLAFSLDTTAKTLSIQDGGATLTVDISSLIGGGNGADNDWTTSGNDIYNGNAGNVGIGVTSPSEKFDIDGNVQFTGSLQPGSQPGTVGQFLISQGANTAPQWQTVAGNDDGDWTIAADTITMYNENIGNVGIGTMIPQTKLHVEGDGFLATGTFGTGPIPTTGAGTRLMWFPGKAAFRVGQVSGTQWDSLNIGKNSFAAGIDTRALGDNSTAFGSLTFASGSASTAFGVSTNATGAVATAFGASTNAFGDRSVSMGFFSNATGANSFAMGQLTIANGINSIAGGFFTVANSSQSVALGNNTTASGENTTALGSYVNTNNNAGTFMYGDNSTTTPMIADSANQFMVRASGGYVLYTTSSGAQSTWNGVALPAGGNSWAFFSDANRKENFKPVNGESLLAKIANFDLTTWNYIGQEAKKFRHYGPMAQDFYAAFGYDGIGKIGSKEMIGTADFLGVSFTAIHALEKRSGEQIQAIQQLMNENEALKTRLNSIEKTLYQLKITLDSPSDSE